MKKKSIKPVTIQIHHNPYALSTSVRINGRPVTRRNALNGIPEHGHLQEWINTLPELLRKQYPRRKYRFIFEGARADFDDLVEVVEATLNKKIRRAVCRHVPAQEPQDKIIQIHRLLAALTDPACPVPALGSPDVIAAFEHAKSDEFEVCVVATMSSGKSTLINALLGNRLMPSRQDACTAIVTRIRDEDDLGETGFRGLAYDSQGKLVEEMPELTPEKMAELNDKPSVTTLEVEGDIPFVASEKLSLVLVDTPGPNNARNQCHRNVQRAFLNKSSKAVILYVMTGQFGTDDDHALLDRITRSMSVGGKQSRDRFIFVVNKMDCYKQEDGDPAQTLQSIRGYLESHGVVNPSIFPVAALPAMNIRCELSGMELDEDDADETAIAIRKLNRTPEMHLESYARRFTSLPELTIDELDAQCRAFAEAWRARGGKPNDDPHEALIHTGIPTLEAAIRVYMEKYAYPAKIRTIAETLAHRLEEIEAEAATKPLDATAWEFLDYVRRQLDDLLEIPPEKRESRNFPVPPVHDVAERKDRAPERPKREIGIKYNPYTVESVFTLDGVEPTGNSWFAAISAKRLQEWVDDLPRYLVDELNETAFHIKFHGTEPDLADLRESLEAAAGKIPGFRYALEHIPAKEVADREAKIREIFEEFKTIQSNEDLSDLRELASPKLLAAFNNALNPEFEIFVMGSRSPGKSTLINAMLGTQLMPTKREAGTASVIRIKDVQGDASDAPVRAEAYDSLDGGSMLQAIERARPWDMECMNARDDVRRIEVKSPIPLFGPSKLSPVLIDTPDSTLNMVYSNVEWKALDNTAKPLVLYLMSGELGRADRAWLSRIGNAMRCRSGKQERDRFLFVVNKLDAHKKEDGELGEFLKNVRKLLQLCGIEEPGIFPISALQALNIKLLRSGELDDEDDIDETEGKIRRFNRSTKWHLEKTVRHPGRVLTKIDAALERARAEWQGEELENPDEALIHTGVPSLEAAIRLYVEKYARPAKIKTLVDTFRGRLESSGIMTKLEHAIAAATRTNLWWSVSQEQKLEKVPKLERQRAFLENIKARLEAVLGI